MRCPRVVIAGLAGDSGKTFLSCGITAALRQNGKTVRAFKKGPDYIDAAWLRLASGNNVSNLDTFLMGKENVFLSFFENAADSDISIVEGNRGLYDGFDKDGTHSTAELAKIISSPVILVFSARKITRTAAAVVLGCQMLDRNVNLAAVVLNQVQGSRHENILRNAIEEYTGIPVVGALPRLKQNNLMPARHLGLITPGEFDSAEKTVSLLADNVRNYTELNSIVKIAETAEDIDYNPQIKDIRINTQVKIGYFSDRAFSFYYPENLDALENAGAELIKISSVEDKMLPDIDALYIGGGFPESNIEAIADNHKLMHTVRKASENGMPIYAECGGLIYLTRSITIDNKKYNLCGVFAADAVMENRPQGHGYCEATADIANPYYKLGTKIKGHEFHYSKLMNCDKELVGSLKITRGTGCFDKRDGLLYKNTFAAYIHTHVLGNESWAQAMINNAIEYKNRQRTAEKID